MSMLMFNLHQQKPADLIIQSSADQIRLRVIRGHLANLVSKPILHKHRATLREAINDSSSLQKNNNNNNEYNHINGLVQQIQKNINKYKQYKQYNRTKQSEVLLNQKH